MIRSQVVLMANILLFPYTFLFSKTLVSVLNLYCFAIAVQLLSHVHLFVTLQTVAH